MSPLFLFPSSMKRDPAVEVWMHAHVGELGAIARRWFDALRGCGDDVRELLHDGHPTACVGEAAFACVNAFTAHVNVGFFRGAEIADPTGLLEGTGRFMRHVKLSPTRDVDAAALMTLIKAAYSDMNRRVKAAPASGQAGGSSLAQAASPGDTEGKRNLVSISPFFIVKDLQASIAHYIERFGFQLDFQGPADDVYYGHVSRDGIGMMLKAIAPDVLPCPNHTRHEWARWDAYIYTQDPDALFAEFKERGASFVKELSYVDDGLWGFEVTDADGYVIAFFRERIALLDP